MLSYPQHTATLTVSRAAICHNWQLLDSLSDANCQTGAVIKANAYGLGMVPISLALYQAGCRYFYTARLHESLALSDAFAAQGYDEAKIIIFDGMMAGQEEAFLAAPLIGVINDETQLQRTKALAAATGKTLDVIIHIDTAMARLGFSPEDWLRISTASRWDDGLNIVMIMSHLASADDKQAAQNQTQLALFNELVEGYVAQTNTPLSLANSGGSLLDSAYHFQATRPGLSLFGLSPHDDALPLAPVIKLTADILQIRDVPAGATIGYGASFIAPHPMRLATLGIGYADGFLRGYKDHVMPRLHGIACPLVGRISMDSCVIDITALSQAQAKSAKQAVIFDSTFTPKDLAHKTGTIGYEVMTTLGERLLRLYDDHDE